MNDLIQRVGAWGLATFPDATEQGIINHLKDEVATEVYPGCDPSELADTVILAIQVARHRGIDLIAEIEKKLAINMARTWPTEPNEEGFYPHVKE